MTPVTAEKVYGRVNSSELKFSFQPSYFPDHKTSRFGDDKRYLAHKWQSQEKVSFSIFLFSKMFYRRRDRAESEADKPEIEEEKEKRPRMSGSLIQNPHDDITTRIKNIEYIEIGRHRLR